MKMKEEGREPKEILREAREAKNLTQTDLANKIGLSLRMYQRIESGMFPKYKYDTIKAIDDVLGTKLYDIIYDTEVSRETISEPKMSYTKQRLEKKNTESDYLVPFVDIPAQAGYTKAYQQIDYIATLKKYPILPDVDPTGLTWRYFQISGESMEPEIMEGDTILCSQVNKEDWQSIKNYYTHVIVTDESLWIKDVYRDTETQWFLLSQNEAYKPFMISVEEIKQVWVMRRHIKGRVKKHRRYDIDEIKKQISSGKSQKGKWANPHPFQKLKDK